MTRDRSLPSSWTVALLREESDVWAARKLVRAACERAGSVETTTEALVTASSELARNIILYAGHGDLSVGTTDSPLGRSVVVRASDQGPGIASVEDAMKDGFSTGKGLGLGLPSARRLVDEFEIVSALGAGTTITLWKRILLEPTP